MFEKTIPWHQSHHRSGKWFYLRTLSHRQIWYHCLAPEVVRNQRLGDKKEIKEHAYLYRRSKTLPCTGSKRRLGLLGPTRKKYRAAGLYQKMAPGLHCIAAGIQETRINIFCIWSLWDPSERTPCGVLLVLYTWFVSWWVCWLAVLVGGRLCEWDPHNC